MQLVLPLELLERKRDVVFPLLLLLLLLVLVLVLDLLLTVVSSSVHISLHLIVTVLGAQVARRCEHHLDVGLLLRKLSHSAGFKQMGFK